MLYCHCRSIACYDGLVVVVAVAGVDVYFGVGVVVDGGYVVAELVAVVGVTMLRIRGTLMLLSMLVFCVIIVGVTVAVAYVVICVVMCCVIAIASYTAVTHGHDGVVTVARFDVVGSVAFVAGGIAVVVVAVVYIIVVIVFAVIIMCVIIYSVIMCIVRSLCHCCWRCV